MVPPPAFPLGGSATSYYEAHTHTTEPFLRAPVEITPPMAPAP